VGNGKLKAISPLEGYRQTYGATTLREVNDLSITSISFHLHFRSTIEAAIATLPGMSAPNADMRLLRLRQDLFFFLSGIRPGQPRIDLRRHVGDHAYLADQSDAWVLLEIDGEKAEAALERICPIDLHAAVFPEGAFARTMMAHLGAIVVRTGPRQFLLLSASSSAGSFLHEVATSLRNVA
jgi:sarcosine oxidase subunit gamma